jgi:hypothetical protein
MPRVVHLRDHLRPLPIFIRRLFWVYYAFIGNGWAAVKGGRI